MMMVRMAWHSPEKRKFRWGLDKRREIPEKVCLMRCRIRAAMSDGMRMKVFSLLWSTYNTNNTGTSQYLGYQHGPLTYSKTAFPSDTTLPLQAPSTSGVACHTGGVRFR